MDDNEKLITDILPEEPEWPVTRESLYQLVWSEPMLKVAGRFGVSSSYMARVCTLLNVPRPERGYWAKLTAGKAPKQPALAEPQSGDPLEWTRDGTIPKRLRPLPKPPIPKRRKPQTSASARMDVHPLIEGAKAHFEAGRMAYQGNYLKPKKHLLVDLAVTKPALDKALTFANQLFRTLETRGYRVVIAPSWEKFQRANVDEREYPERNPHYNNLWGPQRCTIVYVGSVAIGLTIMELSEVAEARHVNGEYIRLTDHVPKRRGRYALDHGWTTKHQFPTERLCLQAYSPYPRASWTQQWRETKNRDILGRIPAIVRELEKATIELARLVEEGERQAERERLEWAAQQEEWRREEAERHAAKALKDSKKELLEIIEAWAAAKRLDEFFIDAKHKVMDLPSDQRAPTMERLERARALIGSTHALEQFRSWRKPEER